MFFALLYFCDDMEKNKHLKSQKLLFVVIVRPEQLKYQFSIAASCTNCRLYGDYIKYEFIGYRIGIGHEKQELIG